MYSYEYLCAMINQFLNFCFHPLCSLFLQVFESWSFWLQKFNGLPFFLILYFLCTPLHRLAVCIFQPCLTRFQWNWYLLPYAYILNKYSNFQTCPITYNYILLQRRTLHSKVNDSITHNSIVILSFKGRLVC